MKSGGEYFLSFNWEMPPNSEHTSPATVTFWNKPEETLTLIKPSRCQAGFGTAGGSLGVSSTTPALGARMPHGSREQTPTKGSSLSIPTAKEGLKGEARQGATPSLLCPPRFEKGERARERGWSQANEPAADQRQPRGSQRSVTQQAELP